MVIAFIPVRGGSKSIPLKNIKDFCGKPLVYWSALALQNCSLVDKIIIATDSSKIEETVRSFKLNKLTVFRRSAENACDTASTESVMLEYINKVSLNLKDIFLLVQATSPLTKQSVYYKSNKRSVMFYLYFRWPQTYLNLHENLPNSDCSPS